MEKVAGMILIVSIRKLSVFVLKIFCLRFPDGALPKGNWALLHRETNVNNKIPDILPNQLNSRGF